MQFNCALYKMNLFRSPLPLKDYLIEEIYNVSLDFKKNVLFNEPLIY